MKFLVSILSLISLSATANIGDSVTHTYSFNGQSGFQKQTVTGSDTQAQTYVIQDEISFGGSNETNFNVIPAADLFTQLKASQVLAYCAQIGGVREVVLGQSTCKVSGDKLSELGLSSSLKAMNTDVIWIGNIPVNGIVKAVLSNGLIMTVSNYNWSK
jgi:hypothetical protein